MPSSPTVFLALAVVAALNAAVIGTPAPAVLASKPADSPTALLVNAVHDGDHTSLVSAIPGRDADDDPSADVQPGAARDPDQKAPADDISGVAPDVATNMTRSSLWSTSVSYLSTGSSSRALYARLSNGYNLPVCDDWFGHNEALVACRSILRQVYPPNACWWFRATYRTSYYHPSIVYGSRHYALDDVDCASPYYSSYNQCSYRTYPYENCYPGEAVRLTCTFLHYC